MTSGLQIGCAGWNLPKSHQHAFSAAGSHLERSAGRLFAVEINSSFYRPHNFATYQWWNATTPSNFRFSVKVPKAITHGLRLENATGAAEAFLSQVSGLGPKLACLLL